MNNITLRQVNSKDLRALTEFYPEAYGYLAKYKYPERWNWLYRDNPFKAKKDPYVYIATKGQKTIGHAATIMVNCKLFSTTTELGWGSDVIVLPEYRRLGISKRLQSLKIQDYAIDASLSLAPIVQRIKSKLGAVLGPSSIIYVRFLSFSPEFILVRNDRYRYIFYFPMLLIYASLVFIKKLTKKKNNMTFVVTEQESAFFDENDTKLWNTARLQYDFAVERDAKYLNWRYGKQPWIEHHCIRTYDDNQNLAGLLIYRVAKEVHSKTIIILELILGSNKPTIAAESLLQRIEHIATDKNIKQIQIASSDNLTKKALKKSGYIEAGKKTLVINGPKNILKNFNNKSKAMLTKGDQDLDQYPLAKLIRVKDITVFFIKKVLKRMKIIKNI